MTKCSIKVVPAHLVRNRLLQEKGEIGLRGLRSRNFLR